MLTHNWVSQIVSTYHPYSNGNSKSEECSFSQDCMDNCEDMKTLAFVVLFAWVTLPCLTVLLGHLLYQKPIYSVK